MRKLASLLLSALILYAVLATWLSADSYAIAAGSDSGVRIYTPALAVKIVTLVAVRATWAACVFVRMVGPWRRS
jgi:hypothetical protein